MSMVRRFGKTSTYRTDLYIAHGGRRYFGKSKWRDHM